MPPNSGNHVGNHNDNPVFADSANEDYHLAASSPLLDEGEGGINMGRYGGTTEATAINGVITLLNELFSYPQGTEPAPGWIEVGNANDVHWKVKSSEYVLESSNINVNRAYRQVNATEYVVETDIKFDASEGKVIYSHGDQHELYRLDLMADTDRFRLMINDVPHTAYTTVNRNQWYHVKIEAKSSNYVKVWIDNTLTHDVGTGLSFDGWMGAGSYNHNTDGVKFDNFKVSTIGTGGGGGGSTTIPNGDFENGLNSWTATGSWALNGAWTVVNGHVQPGRIGNFAGSYPPESGTGTLTSSTFTINKTYLNFRIGGQDNANANKVRLIVGGQVKKEVGPPGDNGFVDVTWNVSGWNTQSAYIECVDNNSNGGYAWFCVDEFHLSDTPTTSASKPVIVVKRVNTLPDTFTVAQNSPNPFNPETTIEFTLPREFEVTLKIYNILGQEVRALVQDVVSGGRHRVVWNGRDTYGQLVSSGIYFYRFQAGPLDETHKMLILK